MTASVGKQSGIQLTRQAAREQLYESSYWLSAWLEKNDYCDYDTFDGLSARFLRPLTFNNRFFRMALQQGVCRFPINLRRLLGIKKSYPTLSLRWPAERICSLVEELDIHESPPH